MVLQIVPGVFNSRKPLHSKVPFNICLSCQSILQHFQVCTPILTSKNICLTFHYRCSLSQEHLSLNVSTPARLNLKNCPVLSSKLIFQKSGPCHKSFHSCLNHHQAFTPPFVLFSGLETSPNSLNINNKVMLAIGKHHTSVPSFVHVNLQQIFYCSLQSNRKSGQSTVVNFCIENLISKFKLNRRVKRVFTCGNLVHCDSQSPHISTCSVSLELENLWCPVYQRMRHRLLNQDSAE